MSLINKLNSSYKYVVNNSKYVKINYAKVDEMIKKISESEIIYWLDTNSFGILDMSFEEIVNFLLIYHTIGDYCFWGEPKWEIDTPNGKIDGSYAIIYLIINRFKDDNNFDMSFDEFKELLKGNGEIPLLNDRYANLVQMNEFLRKSDKTFGEIIKNMHTDAELLEFIVSHFPYFEDEAEYGNQRIYFYKRAQLFTSDLLHIMKVKCGIKTESSNLIGCADYKIPQVMRCYGMLEFEQSLAEKVDQKIELSENSLQEIEIRANDLEVINYIYEKTGKKYTRMDINNFIWLLGQDKSKMTKPYHRTSTKHY
ncbi:MAG: queuosine salvage family protein [Bacilli bacterium]|nr:queuosine salvage family protein [Bacilli bacterium]